MENGAQEKSWNAKTPQEISSLWKSKLKLKLELLLKLKWLPFIFPDLKQIQNLQGIKLKSKNKNYSFTIHLSTQMQTNESLSQKSGKYFCSQFFYCGS